MESPPSVFRGDLVEYIHESPRARLDDGDDAVERSIYEMTTRQVEIELGIAFRREDASGKGWLNHSRLCRAVQAFGAEHAIDHHALRLAFNYIGLQEAALKQRPPPQQLPRSALVYAPLTRDLAEILLSVEECRRLQVYPPSEVPYEAMGTAGEREAYLRRVCEVRMHTCAASVCAQCRRTQCIAVKRDGNTRDALSMYIVRIYTRTQRMYIHVYTHRHADTDTHVYIYIYIRVIGGRR